MGSLNSHQNHQNEDSASADPLKHLHVQDPEAVATARKAFEEKWSENPSNIATYDDFTSLETLNWGGTFGPVILVKHNSSEKLYTMKIFSQRKVVKLKLADRMVREKRLLQAVRHPFILGLDFHFKDNANLYFVQEYFPGSGEIPGNHYLFTCLRYRAVRFREEVTRFYAAQIVLALEYLHSLDVIFRNLKPENLILDHRGYLKITAFEFAKRVKGRTWTLCGTPEYLAPEIILSRGHGKAADWWTLGVLIYEMTHGRTPFLAEHHIQIYEKIVPWEDESCRIFFLPSSSSELKDLVRNLIQVDLSRRYGNLRNGVNDIKNHLWFGPTDWTALNEGKIAAPIIPRFRDPGETARVQECEENDPFLRLEAQPLFAKDFEDF